MYKIVFKAVRKAWSWYDPAKRAAKMRATVKTQIRKIDGTMSARYTCTLTCEECHKPIEGKADTHHLVAVGSNPTTLVEFLESVRRLFVPPEGLMILCKKCHYKTDSFGGKKKKV